MNVLHSPAGHSPSTVSCTSSATLSNIQISTRRAWIFEGGKLKDTQAKRSTRIDSDKAVSDSDAKAGLLDGPSDVSDSQAVPMRPDSQRIDCFAPPILVYYHAKEAAQLRLSFCAAPYDL